MNFWTGLVILATCLPHIVWADSAAAAAATAVAVASSNAPTTPSAPTTFPCNCPAIYQPVCGTDGNTYSNKCILKCYSDNRPPGYPPFFVKSIGECPKVPCTCTTPINPVCGSDKVTYANECYLECENVNRQLMGLPLIHIAYMGHCKNFPFCNCPNVVIPVCGSDGRTYKNMCYLLCESQWNQWFGKPPIFKKHSSPCKVENCGCPKIYDPYCASDDTTYNNYCEFKCWNRRREQLGLLPLTILYKGKCIYCPCPAVYAPVCGSDGKTYGNSCLLGCENKKRAKMGLPPIIEVSKGECCNCKPFKNYVCATDGMNLFQTFLNPCYVNCENKKRALKGLPPLFIVYYGIC